MRESEIEKYLVDQIKATGGKAYKFKSPQHNKVPDRLVLMPARNTSFVETKATGGRATFPKNAHERGQQREHERLRALGFRVEVIDSKEGVDEFVRALA